MFEIRPETVKTFITDKNIKLPRFQRKQTWNEKKNFELCISLFKDYPLGVTIVNVEKKNGITRWLLDGRQRRNALVKMYEDPENIYLWAKKYIKFHNNSQPDEIREMFKDMINEYVEYDEDDSNYIATEETNIDTTDPIEDAADSPENIQANGLEFLLDIILMIHNKQKNLSGFTRPFDLSAYVEKMPYIDIENGKTILSSKRVKTFIDQYRDEYDEYNPETFYTFVGQRMNITNQDKLKKYIENNWKKIQYRISMIERLDSILSNSKIGIIEVKEILFADAQKIFNIINTKGEKLTAAEVLSAKPSWNIQIDFNTAPEDMQKAVENFYKILDIKVEKSIVRWDLPATFLKRIGKNFIIQDFDISVANELSKELTYGFKLLSGIWENGIKKDDIDKLSKNKDIDWLSKYESLISDFHIMLKVIGSFSYFKYFKSWRSSMMELTNDSIALNFLILAYKDWDKKGKPQTASSNQKAFVKNCFILWDKLIYEYLASKWRGSGDSKVGKNISELSNALSANPLLIYEPVSTDDWAKLLQEIYDKYTVFGENVDEKKMKPILYHFYSLKSILGPDTDCEIEVDHIIPQKAFATAAATTINPNAKDSLYNLGLLPKRENINKCDKMLKKIDDPWLIEQIEKYEFIDRSKFDEFSDIANAQDLFEEHYNLFKKAFLEKSARQKLIDN